MTRRTRRPRLWRIFLLLALIGGLLYINQVVVPATPPLFTTTATPTRSPESYINQAQAFYQAGKLTQAMEAYKEAIKAGLTTLTDVIAATADGRDIEDVIATRKRELEMLDEAEVESDCTVPEPVEQVEPVAATAPVDQPDQQDAADAEDAAARVVPIARKA